MSRAVVLAVLIAAAPGVATACRFAPPGPGERMAERYVTVAVVEVTASTAADLARPAREWSAEARVVETTEGLVQPGPFRLWNAERTECPTRRPFPAVGERWVIYLEALHGPDSLVTEMWPLVWSRRLDRRFGGDPAGPDPY